MVNLVVVKLGQSAWKAPKKAGPPKETEKPESDFGTEIFFNPFTLYVLILMLLSISHVFFNALSENLVLVHQDIMPS